MELWGLCPSPHTVPPPTSRDAPTNLRKGSLPAKRTFFGNQEAKQILTFNVQRAVAEDRQKGV